MRQAFERIRLPWRIFLLNALVFVAGALALVLSPATVSSPPRVAEVVVLALGLVASLLVNLVLVRRSLGPLERLAAAMRSVDLLEPRRRVAVGGPPEVREVGGVFNEMLARLESERHTAARERIRAQEDERRRVARELHDEVGQAVTAIVLQLGRLQRTAPPEIREELLEALEATRASLDDVRRIARRLRPEALDDLGLGAALHALAASFERATGVRVDVRVGALPGLDSETELVVFRVAQESLTNVARHAHATRATLALDAVPERLVLSVRDDGRGMNGAAAGGGIRGMRERALAVGGELDVRSSDDGAEVRLAVPWRTP